MIKRAIMYGSRKHQCKYYEQDDIPEILEPFFFWKTSALLSEKTGARRPPLPEVFSEKMCCYLCGLWHKPGAGPDAFFVVKNRISPVEIKATITSAGFQEVANPDFDFLYWLSCSDLDRLRMKVFRFTRGEIDAFRRKKRATKYGLKELADFLERSPVRSAKIGIV